MKKYIYLFLILTIVFSSCETEEPIPTYTLSTSISPTEGGKITVSPQSPNYKEGEMVTLTPEPNEHWVFKQWEGDGSGSSSPLQITMTSDKSVVGVFVKRDYPLTITIEGEGTVEEKIVTNPSGREYPHGTTVELTPKPKDGWVFDSWSGDLSGTETPKTITVDKEKKVTVKFKRRDYPLNITIEGEGTVEEKIVTNPGGREYPFQTVVELIPVPKEGWVFDSWSGDLSGTETPKTITVDKEKNVTVKFKTNPNFYLNQNGITCMCPNSQVGEKGIINGQLFESVDRDLLIKRRNEGKDLTKVCTSLVTNMNYMFQLSQFNQPIGNWDVSKVTDFSGMFFNSKFNQPIGNWDVSKVTDFSGMFDNSQFNQPIGNWNVGSGTNMSLMFQNSQFNQPIENWNVSSVTDMNNMFGFSIFNQQIGNWNVSSVKDMNRMFSNSQFNQPIGNWNVSKVFNFFMMFVDSQFNQPIGNWDVSSGTNMYLMFSNSQFNQPIENWNVSKVTNFSGMFFNSKFNQPIGNWDVSSGTDMRVMFEKSKFNQPIGNWNVSKVTDMEMMFSNSQFNQPIGNWNVSSVTNMNYMFQLSQFNQPIENWNVNKVTNMVGMFLFSQFNQNISKWCVTNVKSEPQNFSTNSPLTSDNKPKWGMCPD